MTTKLRPIRTTARAASVKRRDVASAVKAVVKSRETARFVDRKDRKAPAGDRK